MMDGPVMAVWLLSSEPVEGPSGGLGCKQAIHTILVYRQRVRNAPIAQVQLSCRRVTAAVTMGQ